MVINTETNIANTKHLSLLFTAMFACQGVLQGIISLPALFN